MNMLPEAILREFVVRFSIFGLGYGYAHSASRSPE